VPTKGLETREEVEYFSRSYGAVFPAEFYGQSRNYVTFHPSLASPHFGGLRDGIDSVWTVKEIEFYTCANRDELKSPSTYALFIRSRRPFPVRSFAHITRPHFLECLQTFLSRIEKRAIDLESLVVFRVLELTLSVEVDGNNVNGQL